MGKQLILVCLVVILFSANSIFAQDQPPSADQIVSRMQSKLNLTQDQVTAITPIIEKYTAKRMELKQGVEDGTIDRHDMRDQMQELKADQKQELSQILNPDQLSQWETMQGHQMHQHHEGKEGQGEGDHGQ